MRILLALLLGAVLSTGVANNVPAQAREGTVAIVIAAPSSGVAQVEERYALSSSLPVELRVLTRPCAQIENMRIERSGFPLNLVESRDGPWVTLRDTTPGDSLPLVVRYDVRLAGTGTIPLVHLGAPLARDNSARLGAVSVEVTLPDDGRRVGFPHMTRQAPGVWSARYVGVPSFVEIAGDEAGKCAEQAMAGDNGGLVWRFFLLLGIMVAWVPLYLAWARKSGESG